MAYNYPAWAPYDAGRGGAKPGLAEADTRQRERAGAYDPVKNLVAAGLHRRVICRI